MHPEREQFIRNLFISAESKDYHENFRRRRIVSPDFIRIILQDAQRDTVAVRRQLSEHIGRFFEHNADNSLILNSKDLLLADQSLSILDQLVAFMMRSVSCQQDIDRYAELLTSISCHYNIGLKNITALTRQLGRDYHLEKFNELRFRFVVKIVQKFYMSKPQLRSEPLNYFYLYGPESGVRMRAVDTKWPFAQFLSVVLCFSYVASKNVGYLLWLESSQEQIITIHIEKNSLRCQLFSSQVELCEVQPGGWYLLSFQYDMASGRIFGFVNQQSFSRNGLPVLKPDNQRLLSNITFGRDLQGKLSSIIVFTGPLNNENFFKEMPFGVESWQLLRLIREKRQFEAAYLSYLPFVMFSTHQHWDSCFDVFKRNHGELLQNTTFYESRFSTESIGRFGGLRILLPLFYLVQFYPDQQNSLLGEVLSLVTALFQHKFNNVEKDAIECDFFPTMALHINRLGPRYLTTELIAMLKDLKSAIHDTSLKQQYFKHVLWGLKVHLVSDPTTIEAIYRLISSSYQINLNFYQNTFGVEAIIYSAIRNFEGVSTSCCAQHYINQTLLDDRPLAKHVKQLGQYQYSLHLRYVEEIVTYIIREQLKQDYRSAVNQVKFIFRLLLQKHTSCFYLSLINIAKSVLRVGEQGRGAEAEFVLKQCNILGYLYHLCEKTINPDIIASVLDIVFFLYNRFRRYLEEQRVMSFIVGLFRKLPPFLYMGPRSRSKAVLIRSIRKKSLQQFEREFKVYPREQYRHHSIDRRLVPCTRELTIEDVRHVIPIKPKTLANSAEVYNSIRRFYCLKNFDEDNIVVDNEDAFKVLNEFYRIALPQLKEIILVEILAMIKLSQQNATFLQNSAIFNMFIVRVLSEEQHDKPVSYEMALKVIAELFQGNARNKKMFTQYYVLVKCCCQIVQKEAGVSIKVMQTILLELFRRATVENELPYGVMALLSESVLNQLFDCQGNPKQFSEMRVVFDRVVEMVYTALTAEISYLSQDYFESSTIFAAVIDSKYHSPVREYLLKELSYTSQDDVIMIFDNLVNKSLTKPTVEVEAIVKKKTYVVEAYIEILKQLCLTTSETQPPQERNLAALDHYLKTLTKLTVAFVCLLTNEQSKKSAKLDNNVLGRKVVVQVCQFLYHHYELGEHTRPLYQRYLLKLFQFVFEYIDYIDGVLGRHDNFGKLLHRLNDLTRTNYNPFLIELFEFFIRNEQNKPLMSLIDVANLVKYKFEYLKETVLKADFAFCFNRPTLRQVVQLCHIKDVEMFGVHHRKLIIARKEQLEHELREVDCQASITGEIIQLFDLENPAEERARISFISGQEKTLRKTMESWSRNWKHLRLYDKPYGIWMDQKDTLIGSGPKPTSRNPDKNFKLRLSKYTCSEVRSRPLMSCSIVQPWHIVKRKYEDKAEHMLNINMLPRKDLVGDYKYTIKDIFMFKFVKLRNTGKDDKNFRVVWITDSIKIKGFVHMYHDYLLFEYDGVTQADSHLSFSQFRLEVFNRLYKKWYYVDIANMIRRRYLTKYSCIEVAMSCHSSILLDFQSPELLNQFLEQINGIRRTRLAKSKQLILLNRVPFFTENFLTDMPAVNIHNSTFTEDWRQRRISNLAYLLLLNTLSSRNFHDYSQYPVFPWVVQMSTAKSPQIRDLSKTMGGLGASERIEVLKEKYNSEDPFNPVPKFYYGTHYSSPGVVFNYLIRLSPFTECCKQLQGGKFDLADRMFFSMISSWRSATREMSDVRELIPQFYYLPEAFLNREGLNLGIMQSGDVVDDVELPVWAANAYHFVTQLRQIFESEEVSSRINHWIDLVFGYKQKGKEAENNMNVFYYLTYEDGIKLEEIKDDVHRTSCEAQIIHFGQTPSQLFDKPHPTRQPTDKHHFELVLRRNIKLPAKEPTEQVLGSFYTDSQLLLVFKNRLVSYQLSKDGITSKQMFQLQFQKSISNRHVNAAKSIFVMAVDECRTCFFAEGRYLVISGYVDCSYRVYRTVNGELVAFGTAGSRISCMLLSQRQDLLLIGTESGCLQIVEIRHDGPAALNLKLIHEEYFEQRITHLSENQNFFAVSYGEYVALYRFTRSLYYLVECKSDRKPKIKFFRSLRNRSRINGSIIVESPLFGLVIYDNLGVKCYGGNGQLLANVTTPTSVNELVLVKDSSLHDIVVYLQDDKLIALSTPDLRRISMIDVPHQVTFARGLLVGRTEGVQLYSGN